MLKKFFLILFSFISVSAFCEKKVETTTIDNINSIEVACDTETSILELTVFSSNSDTYDQGFVDQILSENLEEALENFGFSNAKLLITTVNSKDKGGKFTSLYKKYKLD
ncbi:hypothetical protein [Treponema sp.]|uniref:hypothetical protein n=1 Tax=Treponema sp. TaxID=166 RepID=UPI003890350A